MHEEMAFFSLNPTKLVQGIKYATEQQGGQIFVIDEGTKIVASLGVIWTTDWYSDDVYVLERWNFVHPAYRRGGDYARKLLEQGKWISEWFKQIHGSRIPFQCGINSLDRTEAKIRLYARHMPCIGAYFMYGHAPRLSNKLAAEMAHINEVAR